MPSLETQKAIAARVKRARYLLSVDQPAQCLRVLEGLERILPEPDSRHIESAARLSRSKTYINGATEIEVT